MTQIFKCQFGSHIYGTNLPTSDKDYKSVFLPDARDLVLQRAAKHIEANTKSDPTQKNLPTDIDDEGYSLQEFMKLLCQGQTVTLDMLFTPKDFWVQASSLWNDIYDNRNKFLHKGTSAFVGYTRAQAAKYGVKGFRVGAVKHALWMFNSITDTGQRLSDVDGLIDDWVKSAKNEHLSIIEIDGPQGKKERALDVCGRKIPYHARVAYVQGVLQRIYNNYGARAKLAENNEGIDWKALMHAVRVAHEAEELLLTGHITFPRPEKELLLKIRQGLMPYKEIESIIEDGLDKVDAAQKKSTLPDKPDYAWVDEFVYQKHLMIISRL